MSGGAVPQDNSVALAQIENQQAEAARAEEARKEAEARSRFEGQLNTSYSGALDDARAYFESRGLNPDDYTAAIQRAANSAKSKVPDLASAPGSYFDNLGATVYGSENDSARNKYLRDINTFAGDGFATRRISDTSDDAVLEGILNEQRGSADQYIKNLLDRGVITGAGYNAARGDLDQQTFGARSRLSEVGNQVLDSGRSKAQGIAGEARQRASNYNLGDSFNPFDYSGQLDAAFGDFFSNLGNNVRAKVPSGLFSTSGLANVAGAAQGAQNTKFNPNALAGVFGDMEDEEDESNALLSAF